MQTFYVIETRGIFYNRIDYTKRYTRAEALEIVKEGYRKGPNSYDLYTMIKMYY